MAVGQRPCFGGFASVLGLGIDIKNAETFFQMLVELQGESTIDANTFANACVRMKGAATSIDLQTVMFTTHLMNQDHGGPFDVRTFRRKIPSLTPSVSSRS